MVALSPASPSTDGRPSGTPGPRTPGAAAPLIDIPVLYVIAEEDRRSRVADAQALFDATADQRSELLVVPGTAHAQLLLYPPGADLSSPLGGP